MTKRNEPSPSMSLVFMLWHLRCPHRLGTDQQGKLGTSELLHVSDCLFFAQWMATRNSGNFAGCPLRSLTMRRWMEYAESINPVRKVATVEVVWRKWLSSASLVSPRWRVWVPTIGVGKANDLQICEGADDHYRILQVFQLQQGLVSAIIRPLINTQLLRVWCIQVQFICQDLPLKWSKITTWE